MNCEHNWEITEWVVNTDTCQRPARKICTKCNKKKVIEYLGGDMWKWVDEE